jgi:hypothetical protein
LRGCIVEDAIERKCLVFYALALRDYRSRESLDRIVLWRVEDSAGALASILECDNREMPYKHFSSITFITGRMPFELSFGVGAAASDPSPRNKVWSSLLVNWAASRIVNGRTRTVTEMDDAPSAAMIELGED